MPQRLPTNTDRRRLVRPDSRYFCFQTGTMRALSGPERAIQICRDRASNGIHVPSGMGMPVYPAVAPTPYWRGHLSRAPDRRIDLHNNIYAGVNIAFGFPRPVVPKDADTENGYGVAQVVGANGCITASVADFHDALTVEVHALSAGWAVTAGSEPQPSSSTHSTGESRAALLADGQRRSLVEGSFSGEIRDRRLLQPADRIAANGFVPCAPPRESSIAGSYCRS